MLIQTMSIPAIQDLIKKSFVKGVFKPAGDVRQIFHKEVGDWSVNAKRIYEVDRDRFAEQKVEGQASVKKGISQGYYKDINRKTISITRAVSGEAFKALTAHQLSSFATQVAEDLVDKTELDMRNFLGYGDSASFVDNGGFTIDTTVGDGNPLFYATHTLKNVGTTYSNILSGAPSLSENSIDDAEDYFSYNVLDNNGKRLKMKPNTIITSNKASVVNRVSRMLNSMSPEKIEGTANANANVMNPYKAKFKHLAIDFDVTSLDVTDTNKSFYWFLGALGGSPETSFQGYYVSWMSPMVAPEEIDQDKWVLSFTGRSAYGIGAVSGKGLLIVKATS